MNKLVSYYNKDANINCICICKEEFSQSYDDISIILPCEHFTHTKCLSKLISNKCMICDNKIELVIHEVDISNGFIELAKKQKDNSLSKHVRNKYKTRSLILSQYYIDIYCTKKVQSIDRGSLLGFLGSIDMIMFFSYKISTTTSYDELISLTRDFMRFLNINLTVKGEDKIIQDQKLIISNHVSLIDGMIIMTLFKCGFLASSYILQTHIGQYIKDIIPLLIIERGVKGQHTENIKNFLKENKMDVCVFPEGKLSPQETLARFRTGAFYTNVPIQPIIIKYDPIIHNRDYTQFVYNLFSGDELNVEVTILDAEYPPFSQDKVEHIRRKMAKAGNMALSRVSNRAIKD